MTLSELLMQLFSKSARPEADAEQPPQHPLPFRPRPPRHPDDNVNPPHNLPRENLTPEERARRIKEANRQYFKASGGIEAFWAVYPEERPPERERMPKREPKNEPQRGGRGSRDRD
jgi:hypothetical protein